MKKGKIWLISALLLLVIVLGGWRLWPRPLSGWLPEDSEGLTLSASAFIPSTTMGPDPIYSITTSSQDNETFRGILSILESARLRPDFRNLLPERPNIIPSTWGQYSGIITLQDNGQKVLSISFLGDPIILYTNDDERFIFHPVDRGLSEELARYIQAHGTLQEE